jgi:tripartite-type tricarboxylate transporter receptor subunit TctC
MEIAMTSPTQSVPHIAKTLRAIWLPAAAAIVGHLVTASGASAQVYPSRLIKIIGQVPSGSVLDVTARMVAPALSSRLGTPVIIENRAGGGGTIGAREVARATPDGYTLLFGGVNHVIASRTLDYDPVKDFVPIATVATHHWILVVAPSTPAQSLKELIDHARANPGKLYWGFGQGTAPQMFGEMFKAATGTILAGIPACRPCLTCLAAVST